MSSLLFMFTILQSFERLDKWTYKHHKSKQMTWNHTNKKKMNSTIMIAGKDMKKKETNIDRGHQNEM